MSGDKSSGALNPSSTKANTKKPFIAKSKKDAKFTESAPVTENTENARDSPSPTAVEMSLLRNESFIGDFSPKKSASISQPKSYKAALPEVGRTDQILFSKPDDGEKRPQAGEPGVAVPSTNPKLLDKYAIKESRRLWWEQTDAFAHRWGGSSEGKNDMEWVNQYYPKTHWKTRKALAEKMEMDIDENEDENDEDEEKKARTSSKKRRE